MATERIAVTEENAALLERAAELATREELTPAELREFAHALWVSTDRTDEPIEADGAMWLPRGNPTPEYSLYFAGQDVNYAEIISLDHLAPGTGEVVYLTQENGTLVWRLGMLGTFYSEILGRREKLAQPVDIDILPASTTLTCQESAKVARTLWQAYSSELPPT